MQSGISQFWKPMNKKILNVQSQYTTSLTWNKRKHGQCGSEQRFIQLSGLQLIPSHSHQIDGLSNDISERWSESLLRKSFRTERIDSTRPKPWHKCWRHGCFLPGRAEQLKEVLILWYTLSCTYKTLDFPIPGCFKGFEERPTNDETSTAIIEINKCIKFVTLNGRAV